MMRDCGLGQQPYDEEVTWDQNSLRPWISKGSNKHLSHHLSCRQLSATFKTHFSIPQPCSYSSHPPWNSPKSSLYPAGSHIFLGCFVHLLGPRGSLLRTLKHSFKDRLVLLREGFWNHKVYSWITKIFVTNLVYLLIFLSKVPKGFLRSSRFGKHHSREYHSPVPHILTPLRWATLWGAIQSHLCYLPF